MSSELVSMGFQLLVAHAALDFSLQGDTTAREKNPNSTTELQKHVPWYYWMAAHALMHGGGVFLVTGSVVFGICEATWHWGIDYMKCQGWIGIHEDQVLHIFCKAMWLYLLSNW